MSRTGELMAKLVNPADPASGDLSEAIAKAIKPNPSAAQESPAAIVAAARGGREVLESLFSERLVADQLAAIVGRNEENQGRVHALLNSPFPCRKEITVEFLDLLVARIQHLETFVRLLGAALVEMQHPSDCSPINYVSASSATRRQA